MATTIKRHMLTIWPVQSVGTNNPYGHVESVPEIASQSFVYSAPLVYDTSSTAIVLATDSTVAGYGLAMEPASGTTGAMVKVSVFDQNQIYRAPVLNAGATAANAAAMIGVPYSFVARSDGYGYGIDTADTGSNDWFQVIAMAPDSPAGSDPGYVLVRVLPAVMLDPNIA